MNFLLILSRMNTPNDCISAPARTAHDSSRCRPMTIARRDPPSHRLSPGRPRLRTANRQQIVFRAAALDALIPPRSPRADRLGLSSSGSTLAPCTNPSSPSHGTGRDGPRIDPKILMALWLYATIDGVGSARQLDELCRSHDAFQLDRRRCLDQLSYPRRFPHRPRRIARPVADPERRDPDGRGTGRSEPGGAGRDAGPRQRRCRVVPPPADAGGGAGRGRGPGPGVAGGVGGRPGRRRPPATSGPRAGGPRTGRADQGGVGAVAGVGGQEEAGGS